VDQGEKMDRFYGWQRHIYDATRKFYLPGRDLLLQRLHVTGNRSVLEVGCGTGRNLARLSRLGSGLQLYGLDVSAVMLHTASRKLGTRAVLCRTLAECFDHRDTFGLGEPFDCIFISYSLSMMPGWRQAIDCCLRNLKPGGELHIVDFWDQAGWPCFFRIVLRRWLSLFGVRYRPEMLFYLRALDTEGLVTLTIETVARRYAFLAHLRKFS